MQCEINLNTTKLEEALAQINFYDIEMGTTLEQPIGEVERIWNLAWDYEDKSENFNENAVAVIEFVMKHQNDFGLVEILHDDNMPMDSRVLFHYKPSYALASILIYYHSFDSTFLDEVPERRAAFNSLLKACLGRKLKGHGYDAEIEKLEVLELFAGNRFIKFFKQRPDGCYDFLITVSLAMAFVVNQILYHGPVKVNAFNKVNCSKRAYRIAAKFAGKKNLMFVYGTLLPGESAEHKLRNAFPLGEGLLPGFAMFNLGNFPGVIVGDEDDFVEGKIFCVDDDQLQALDYYEGEGSLYRRDQVDVIARYATIPCYTYVFDNHVPNGAEKLTNWKER